MENVTLVMTRTSNSFDEIMKMPIACFLSIIKNIRMEELMQNPKWREKYLKQKLVEAYKDNKVIKNTKIDLKGLESLSNSL